MLCGAEWLERQMPFGKALQAQRRVEPGPLRAQHRNGVSLLADFRAQAEHALGALGRFHLDPVDVGGGEYQHADDEEVDDPHDRPPLAMPSRVGQSGKGAATWAGAPVRSAARSLAERARGLAEISASSAVT